MEVMRDRAGSVELEEFLARPLFAHLATASEDGPRDSPVWFLWENEAVWIIASRSTDSFPARIEADARCAVGIVDFDRGSGLVQHVGMRGLATVEPFDAQRARRLLARYVGADDREWDDRFRTTVTDPASEQAVLVRFVPETVVARDVSFSSGSLGAVRPQPLISVTDVPRSSRWYQQLLGCRSGHGGHEYERLLNDDTLVLQLHSFEVEHHHRAIGDVSSRPYGNGLALWFEVDDFDAAVARADGLDADIVRPPHRNPPDGPGGPAHRELWLHDPDGYLVVLASPDGESLWPDRRVSAE